MGGFRGSSTYSFMLDTDNNFPEADPKLLHELLRANAEKCKNCLKAKLALAMDLWSPAALKPFVLAF